MPPSTTTDDLITAVDGISFNDIPRRTDHGHSNTRISFHHPTRLSDIGEEDATDAMTRGNDNGFDKEDEDTDSCCSSWQDLSACGEKHEASGLRDAEDLAKADRPSEADRRAFFKASVFGDITVLQQKLALGVGIESHTSKGFTALVIAIIEMRVEAVEFLLRNGADPNNRTLQIPPIVHAITITRSSTEIMQLLIDHGACLNSVSGPDHKTALHWAVSENKPEAVHLLINKGMDLERTCRSGRTPLLLAAELGHIEVAKVLLEHGAKFDVRSENGGTPLIWSAANNHVEALDLWLEHGLDMNATDNQGLSAIFLASHFGSLGAVRRLLDAGADASMASNDPPNFTPLMAAACTGQSEIIQILAEHGCDLEIKNNAGENALDLAFSEHKPEAIRTLLKLMGGPEYDRDSVSLQIAMVNSFHAMMAISSVTALMYRQLPIIDFEDNKFAWMDWALRDGGELVKPKALRRMLHAALDSQDVEWIRALARHGCDMSSPVDSGRTPLTFAIGHGYTEIVQALLEAGADPNISGTDGCGALDYALINMDDCEDTTVVDLLLKSSRCRINMGRYTAFSYILSKQEAWGTKARALAIRMIDSVEDVNEDRNFVGATLLHIAVSLKSEFFVDLLLLSGADIEATDNDGITPLHTASSHSSRMLSILINHGANIHAKYKANAGALAAAAAYGNVESLEILLDHGLDMEARTEKGYTALACSLTWAQEEAALFLMEKGANVHWQTHKNQTALHFAAENKLEIVVEELLKRSVEVNTKDYEGWTPLLQACATGNANIVRMILDAGGDIEAELPNKDRPLHVALINEREEIAELLISRGADITVRASRERTCLHLAAEYGVPTVARILLDKGASTEDVDEETWTPLCCTGFPELVSLLVLRGANVNYADKDNWTPLHQAVSNYDFYTTLHLMEAGARVDVRTTDDGLTVMERAKGLDDKMQRERFVRMLEEQIFFQEAERSRKTSQARNATESKHLECELVELDGGFVEISSQEASS